MGGVDSIEIVLWIPKGYVNCRWRYWKNKLHKTKIYTHTHPSMLTSTTHLLSTFLISASTSTLTTTHSLSSLLPLQPWCVFLWCSFPHTSQHNLRYHLWLMSASSNYFPEISGDLSQVRPFLCHFLIRVCLISIPIRNVPFNWSRCEHQTTALLHDS